MSPGPFTVYSQHRRRFNESNKKDWEPRQQMLKDLTKSIKKWKNKGEQIVLLMDCNEDVRSDNIKKFLAQVEMREAILHKHGSQHAPGTHIDGTKPIDGIFTTRSISVQSCGYCSFDEGVIGKRTDHRCLWVDLRIPNVFGEKMPPLMKFSGRRVKTSDPRIVQRFNHHYKKFAIKHNLSQRIFNLENKVTCPITETHRLEAEAIASLREQGIQYADKRCRRLFQGLIPFSPEVNDLMLRARFWKLALDKKLGRKISSRLLVRTMRKAKISTPLIELMARSKDSIESELKKSCRQYKLAKKSAYNTRRKWLHDLAEARSQQEKNTKSDDENLAKHIRQIRQVESTRRMFRRIKRSVGKTRMSGVSMIQVPDEYGRWVEVTDHQLMVDALIKEYYAKYHQTEATPPMTYPLRHFLGYLGIGHNAQSVLNGKLPQLPGISPYALRLLKKLKRIESFQTIPVGISTKDYQNGWKKAKEATSSGGLTVHFGHCKAMAQDSQLSSMEAAFLSIPLRSGYPYLRWRKGVDCTLIKKANSFRVNKLRTIVLFEADFNFVNKAVSRKLAYQSEQKNSLAEEQYGSRKNHRSIEHVLNKRLCMDLLRQTKKPGIIAPTDLKSCYDRISHSIASLSMQRQGIQESEILCMFTPLQRLQHTIRCAYGDSTRTYGTESGVAPMQGVYQGNGAGPIIWAVVSSPLLQILREDGFGTFFKSAISRKTIRLVGYAFVDDTDLIQTARPHESFQEVHLHTQQALDLWEGLIKTTGGAIAVDKCRWWGVDFQWDENGNWRYKTKEELNSSLFIKDTNEVLDKVKQLEYNESYETLGVLLAADGNQKDQYEELRDLTADWADRLRISFLSENETVQAIQTSIIKKLEYPLLALTLTREQCDNILKPLLRIALPKTRINRNFCRKTLRAPGGFLGLNFPCLYHSQVIAHMECLLRHGGQSTITGRLLEGSIEVAKAELGLPGKLFSHSASNLSHLITHSWIRDIWHEIQDNEITFSEQTPDLQVKRENDQFIMKAALELELSPLQLRMINKCRIHLQVTTFSDLCSGDGFYLLPYYRERFNPLSQFTDLDWPDQGKPSDKCWRLWQKTIETILPSTSGRLFSPLGNWITRTETWGAVFDSSTKILTIRHDDKWHVFHQNCESFSGDNLRYCYNGTTTEPGYTSHLAVAWLDDDLTLHFHGIGKIRAPNTSDKTNPLQWVTEWLDPPNNLDNIASAISNGTAIAMTDGSYKINGSAAFCIGSSFQNIWRGACRVPGHQLIQNSYRSELCGILGVIVLISKLCCSHDIHEGTITLACDNLSAGHMAVNYKHLISPTINHFDILRVIQQLRSSLPIKIVFKHVEGHQREKYPSQILDNWAILNEEMDSLAKSHLEISQSWIPLSDILHPLEWTLSINSFKVCAFLKKTLDFELRVRTTRQFWIHPKKRGQTIIPPKYTAHQIDSMDIHNIEKAWRKTPGHMKRFICKAASKQLATGKYMNRMKFWPSAKCPRCLTSIETSEHVLQCPSISARQLALSLKQQFAQYLSQIQTAPSLQITLLELVDAAIWDSTPNPHHPFLSTTALQAQLRLDLHDFVCGRLVNTWKDLQSIHITHNNLRSNADTWTQKVIIHIWHMYFQMWIHRNENLHTSESIKDQVFNLNKIDNEIRQQWSLGTQDLNNADCLLFRTTTLNQLLRKNRDYKRTWLRNITLARSSIHKNIPNHESEISEESD